MKIGSFVDNLFMAITDALRKRITAFCVLETSEGPYTYVAKDGSLMTLLNVKGSMSVVGQEELSRLASALAETMAPFMSRRGHAFHWGYLSDPDRVSPDVNSYVDAQRAVARRSGLHIDDILTSQRQVLEDQVCLEQSVIALWTRPSVVSNEILKYAKARQADEVKTAPPVVDGQWVYRVVQEIMQRHQSYVRAVAKGLGHAGLLVEPIEVHDAGRLMREWSLREVVGSSWRPCLPGDKARPRLSESALPNDVSALVWPPLDRQLLPQDAVPIDYEVVRIGQYDYAYLNMMLAPEMPLPFARLLDNLAGQWVPWRMLVMIEGADNAMPVKKATATLTAWSSAASARVKAALSTIAQEMAMGRTYVKLRVSFCTWVPHGDRDLLNRRVNTLRDALTNWGQMHVGTDAGDALAGVMSSSIGIMVGSTAVTTLAPLEEVTPLLPLNQVASPWEQGTMSFVSPEGRLVSYQPGSSRQTTWNTVIFSPPGGGKSLLLNKLNLAVCLSPGVERAGAKLPRIATIDIGFSGKGLVDLLRSALPQQRQHEAVYLRLRLDRSHAVNIFDTALGQRYPTAREREFIQLVLELLCTPEERNRPFEGIANALHSAVTAAYRMRAEEKPNVYHEGLDEEVDEAISRYGIKIDAHTTWWEVVDALFDAGCIREAGLAQRHAVPVLNDLLEAMADPRVSDPYRKMRVQETNEAIIDAMTRYINAAQARYPMLSYPTTWDLANARVIVVDLEEVADGGSGGNNRQTALMYMLARHIAARDFYFSLDEAAATSPKYRDYHMQRVQADRESPKRLNFDEFHKTDGVDAVRRQVVNDMRLGRKYNVQVCLASQQLSDFGDDVLKQASDIIVLKIGNRDELQELVTRFGKENVPRTAQHIIANYLTGPGSEGAPFYGIFKLRGGTFRQYLRHVVGAVEVWGLTTNPRDVPLRDRLYARMDPVLARKVLADEFPDGSAAKVIEDRIRQVKRSGIYSESDAQNIYDELADELEAKAREILRREAVLRGRRKREKVPA